MLSQADLLLPTLTGPCPHSAMEVMNLIEQPIKVTEWQQTYTYDSGIHSGANTCVPSVSSKGVLDEDEVSGHQYTLKKTTTYTQGTPQGQGSLGTSWGAEGIPIPAVMGWALSGVPRLGSR